MTSLSQRLRTKNEATGMRQVSQNVQEYWECGWQPFEHRNDYGIDGLIIMRNKGIDLGAKINVQVKCGASYISSETPEELRICIDGEIGLIKHINYWKRQIEPAVLVFVNPSKPERDKHGNILKDEKNKVKWLDSRLKAKAWWLNLKDANIIAEDTKTILKIDKKKRFGEHSKGEFLRLIKPLTDDNSLQIIELNDEGRKLYLSDNITESAKNFYQIWKSENKQLTTCKALGHDLIISRAGWLHITQSRRGRERRIISFRLLGAAKQIISEADNYILLNQKETDFFVEQKFGLKVKLRIKNESDKVVQVIIVKRKKKLDGKTRYWFYSVHHRR